jgi:hypothetical protein
MKRNESILVYSVTGLLVVILAVAILFGNEHGVQANTSGQARPLDELAGVNAAQASAPPAEGGDASRGLAPSSAGASPGDTNSALAPAEQPGTLYGPPVAVPLTMPAPLAEATEPAADPALQALMLLGDNKRDGQYRIVTVRRDDTFSALVQRWCGGLDQLEVAESLNEELNLQRLEPGAKVCLPWVDDAKLVAAHLARKQRQDNDAKVVTEARDKGLTYTIKSGDKLWNIAVARVGQKNATKFIDEVKALNPELLADPSKLGVGKTIILPR